MSAGARIAGAPISWGVSEVPGWGHQLPADRVLTEMRDIGLTATELGPEGFLPAEPARRAAVLAEHGLAAVGGFLPVVLHEDGPDPLPAVDRTIDGFLAAGAGVLVVAAATGAHGYDARPDLDEIAWKRLLDNLTRVSEHAQSRGVLACLHPHAGTMVETRDDVRRLLDESDVPLCLDTGHLLIGGTDPVALAREAAARIVHVHLKDVDAAWVPRVRAGESSYAQAVAAGMYRPLGHGDAGIAEIVAGLRDAGYDGWYVLEQDTVLTAPPADEGPVRDVVTSIAFLRSCLEGAA